MDRQPGKLVFDAEFPAVVRYLFGLFLLVLGLVSGYSISPVIYAAVPVGIAFLFAQAKTTLDVPSKTYRHVRGIWPFVKVHQGPFAEIRCIRIDQSILNTKAGAQLQCSVSLQWLDPHRKQTLIGTFENLEDGTSFAAKLHQTTDIPLEEGDNLIRLRNVLENPVYRKALIPHP